MKDRRFYYNKANYYLKLKPEIEKYFNAKRLMFFGIVSPYFIPLKDNTNLTYKVNNSELCHFRFFTVENNINVFSGTYREEPVSISKKCSRIEMVYISKDKFSLDENDPFLSQKFDLLIEKLNYLISSIIVLTKNTYVSKITKELLDPIIFYSIIDTKRFELVNEGLFNLNFNKVEQGGEYLSYTDTKRIMEGIDLLPDNPFYRAAELFYLSKRYLYAGDYSRAVIDSQTSVEIFLTALYKFLLRHEGFSVSEIDSKSSKMRLKSMVIDQFHKKLGGDFDIKDTNSPVGGWWKNTYLLRNDVVHEGHLPDYQEAEKCVNAVNTLNKYLTDLFHTEKVKEVFPELSILVGKPTS
jgi:hypothetical protein